MKLSPKSVELTAKHPHFRTSFHPLLSHSSLLVLSEFTASDRTEKEGILETGLKAERSTRWGGYALQSKS